MKQLAVVLLLIVSLTMCGVWGDGGTDTTTAESQEQAAASCVVHCRVESEHAPPVCGSDGVTYGSTCLLRAMQCRDPTITKAHDGKCSDKAHDETQTPPPEIQDDPFHASSEPTTLNPCLRNCTTTAKEELCASNNVTFLNPCHLANAQCDDPQLRVRHRGACVLRLPTRPTFCDGDATTCSRRQRRRAPTCGSDGVTYETACDFKIAFCRSHAKLSVAHEGPCRPA